MGRHCARKSCPFCGWHYSDRKQVLRTAERWYVRCCSCGARGPEAESKSGADYGWNKTLARADRHGDPEDGVPVPLDLAPLKAAGTPE